MINSLLDVDFYKLTMGNFAHEYFSNAVVEYQFTNRNEALKLGDFVSVEDLDGELKKIQNLRFSGDELAYLQKLNVLSDSYLDFLAYIGWRDNILPDINIKKTSDGQLDIRVAGKWPLAIFWETYILSIVNELYYQKLVQDPFQTEMDGYDKLAKKIFTLKQYPKIKFVEFGTRRRYSSKWQETVINSLQVFCPSTQFIGTSNVQLAKKYNLSPFGTFAHELPMVCSGIFYSNRFNSQNVCFNYWWNLFAEKLPTIALTDTFTTEFFLKTFGVGRAKKWMGVRHDSGDPFEFGRRIINFYENLGINTKTKTIVFSDRLDVDLIVKLHEEFNEQINCIFGWGTDLTNDMGLNQLQIVMKPVSVNNVPIVKISDDKGKISGNNDTVELYKKTFEVC